MRYLSGTFGPTNTSECVLCNSLHYSESADNVQMVSCRPQLWHRAPAYCLVMTLELFGLAGTDCPDCLGS